MKELSIEPIVDVITAIGAVTHDAGLCVRGEGYD